MDVKLMKEFEELEGLGENVEDDASQADEDDDDNSLRPVNASNLTTVEIEEAMDKRNLKRTGFPDTDRDLLQKVFDEEFKAELEEVKARRKEARRRAARQAGLQRRRVLMERMLQEEQDELSHNYQIGMMVDLIKDNMVGPSIRVDINSVSGRSLAKALWLNTSITCLDLSSNGINDHCGSYLARILKKNNTLVKLELDNNQLGPETCRAFGESLRVNKSLVYLSLDSNPLTLTSSNPSVKPSLNGFLSMADAFKFNKTLRTLNLWRTHITAAGGTALANSLEANNTILFCDVGYAGLDLIDVKRIADKMDKNLAGYEINERRRRDDVVQTVVREKTRKEKEEEQTKQKELSQWLETRRNQRAEARVNAELDRIEALRLEEEEKARLIAADKERERKEAEEAAAKKNKKKGKGKK